ncbi:MAG TPA: hypothetical protein VD846_03075 [Allosphingosinicella sp.]|nr:hypothetical protein [Allosphingosinicella sp.]
MRMIALAGLALALSACGGGGDDAANEANGLATDNMLMEDNLLLDANTSMNGMTGTDANMTADANTQNMMVEDAGTNDADINLANGL